MILIELEGRLGNQMFQYAFARSCSIISGDTELLLDFTNVYKAGDKKDGFENSLKYFNVIDFKIGRARSELKIYQKFVFYAYFVFWRRINNRVKQHSFEVHTQPLLNLFDLHFFSTGYYPFQIKKRKRNYFYGYFESSKYFDNIKELLYEEFTPLYPELEENKDLYRVIRNTNSICVSIRCGDFINDEEVSKSCYICTPKYFFSAIKYIEEHVENPNFIFFSDDINWVKENLKVKNAFYENQNTPIWEKMRLMYSCKHFIISNSTFSWWAQYLSRNNEKIVIAPDKWREWNNEILDIYDDNWILLSGSNL